MLKIKYTIFILTFYHLLYIISSTKNDCINHQTPNRDIAHEFINNTIPLRYQIYIDPCISDGNYSGYVHIDIILLKATKDISLHSQNLIFCEEGVYLTSKGNVNETFASLKPVKIAEYGASSLQDSEEIQDDSSETVRPSGLVYYDTEQIVTMKFDKFLKSGRYSLEINYMGIINSDSVGVYRKTYKDVDGEKRIMLLTNLYPNSARRVFPCRDDSSIKSEIYFTIQTSLNYTTIMANTPQNFIEYKEGQRWSHFHPTVNTSTYQLNFAVLNNIKNVTVVQANKTFIMYAIASDSKLIELTRNTYEKAIVIMENFTKVNYPSDTLTSLVAPDKVELISSSSLGFITAKKSQALYDDQFGPQKKKDVVLRASRDIANQWFNQIISPSSWKYAWFTEGLSEFMKYYIANKIMPDWKLKDIFVVWELQRRSFIPNKITDGPPLNRDIFDDPESVRCLFTQSVSSTSMSASLIRMISHFLSEDILQTGISRLMNKNKFRSVKPDDLWKILQKAIDETKNHRLENLNIPEIMHSWTDAEFYPIINVTRNYTSGTVMVTQIPAVTFFNLTEKITSHKWWIPLNFATQSNPNFSKTFPRCWLKPTSDQIYFDDVNVDDWIIFNVQQTGYYRILYDEENWKRLATFLNSGNHSLIHPINRAQIINDAIQFSLKSHLDMGIFLDLLSYLQKETDYIPWYDAQFIFSFLNYHLSNTHAYGSLKDFSLRLIIPLVDKIGYTDRPEDDFPTLLLRRITNHWACHFGYKRCWDNATMQLEAYLDDRKEELGAVDLQEWAQCVGLNGANKTVWDKMFMKYQENLSEDTLIYLACSENSTILNDFLSLAVSNCSIVPEKQVISVFKAVCLYPSGDEKRINLCLNFINDEFDNIKARFGNSTESFTYFLDLLASEIRQQSQLNQFQKLIEQDRASFASTKLSARMKQTESRVKVFDQKADYYEPYFKEKLLQLQ